MRLPDSAHTDRPWRVHDLARGMPLVDVWQLPTPGGPDDFQRLVEQVTSADPASEGPRLVRLLFAVRERLGGLLGWDDPATGLGARVTSLQDRLPDDLRGTVPAADPGGLPFVPLYLTADEYAAEIANATVHGLAHLGWVPDGRGGYYGQLAVYAKANGWLGRAYLAGIAPFRHLVVYPALLRAVGRSWSATRPDPETTQGPPP